MADLRARLTTLESELREFLAAGEFQAMAYKLDELAALLREPPDADDDVLSCDRLRELCQQFGLVDTDMLKHRLEDWERWDAEHRALLREPPASGRDADHPRGNSVGNCEGGVRQDLSPSTGCNAPALRREPVVAARKGTRMDITSIDNCYEDDGLIQAQNFLNGLNIEARQNATDPFRRVLVAVLPEFRADGQLDRLNFLTSPAEDPGRATKAELTLMMAAVQIIADVRAKRAAAMAQVHEPRITKLP